MYLVILFPSSGSEFNLMDNEYNKRHVYRKCSKLLNVTLQKTVTPNTGQRFTKKKGHNEVKWKKVVRESKMTRE